ITHIAALIGVRPEGVICVRKRDQPPEDDLLIIAAAGDFCDLIDHPLSAITEEITTYLLRESLNNRCNVFHRNGVALYLGSHTRGDMSCYVASNAPISEVDKGL